MEKGGKDGGRKNTGKLKPQKKKGGTRISRGKKD